MNTKQLLGLGVLAGLLLSKATEITTHNLFYDTKASVGDSVGFRSQALGICVGPVLESSLKRNWGLKKYTVHSVIAICQGGPSVEEVRDDEVLVLREAE